MLKKANRLRSQWDFKRTLAGQRIGSNDCFAIYGLLAPLRPMERDSSRIPPASPRFGFIVSKKINKRATVRNRIKRRFREMIRLWLLSENDRVLIASYRCVVVIARSGSATTDYHELQRRMLACFQRCRPLSADGKARLSPERKPC